MAKKIKTFITSVQKADGRYEGPQIQASSWRKAKARAQELGVVVEGILDSVHYQEPV